MRAICCSCELLVAPGDEELFRVYLTHIRDQHPEIQLTDLQLHTVLLYAAHEVDASEASRSKRLMGGAQPEAPSPRLTYDRPEEVR
jgi:hypothetical protein